MSQENKEILRIKELVAQLNEASKAYYQDGKEIISNFEYDKFTMLLSSIPIFLSFPTVLKICIAV